MTTPVADPRTADELFRAAVAFVVFLPVLFSGLWVLARVGLAPDTKLSSVYVANHEINYDVRDRIGSLIFTLVLLMSMAVGFVIAE